MITYNFFVIYFEIKPCHQFSSSCLNGKCVLHKIDHQSIKLSLRESLKTKSFLSTTLLVSYKVKEDRQDTINLGRTSMGRVTHHDTTRGHDPC